MPLEVDRFDATLAVAAIHHNESQTDSITNFANRSIGFSANRDDGWSLPEPIQVRSDLMNSPELAQILFILDPNAKIRPDGPDDLALHGESRRLVSKLAGIYQVIRRVLITCRR